MLRVMLIAALSVLGCLSINVRLINAKYVPSTLTENADLPRYAGTAKKENVAVASHVIEKRSPWAPTEVRMDTFMHKLRSRMHVNKDSYGETVRPGRQARSVPSNEENVDQKYEVISDKIRQIVELLTQLRDLKPDSEIDEYINRLQLDYQSGDGSTQTSEVKRSFLGNDAERRKSIHPVYLGMGQQTAGAALDTLASLLADDEKRIQKNSNLPNTPVRFIGK